MERLLTLGSWLALVGVPLVCSTWLADAVTLPKEALFTVAATLIVSVWLAGWWEGRWPLLRRGAWTWLAAAPYLWSLLSFRSVGVAECALAVGLALTGLAWNATLTPERSARYVNWVVWTAALLALYSWAQRLGLDPVAWDNPHLSRERTIATMGNPDFLALYLVVAAPLALERGGRRPWALLLWLLGCQAMILTTTRASWVAGAAAGCVWLWQHRRRPQLTVALGLALVLLLGVTSYVQRAQTSGFSVTQRMRSLGDLQEHSFQTRLFLWYSAAQLAQRSPLLGRGWGTFRYEALEFRELEPARTRLLARLPEDPHSQLFRWLVVGGYPALLFWLASLLVLVWRAPTPGARCAGVALGVNLLFLSSTLEGSLLALFLYGWTACSQPGVAQRPARPGLGWLLPVSLGLAATVWSGRAVAAERALWWGDDYLLAGKPLEADRYYLQAVELAGPGQLPVALERRVRVRMQVLGTNFQEPLARETEALVGALTELTPANPYLMATRARLYGWWKRPVEADQAWAAALQGDPRNPNFWAERALALANQGRFEEALTTLDRALEIAPDSPEFQLHKAHLLLDLHRSEEARKLLLKTGQDYPERSKDVKALLERLTGQ